jgi:hypothetical protein
MSRSHLHAIFQEYNGSFAEGYLAEDIYVQRRVRGV